ncbi:hypothetical protein MACH16_31400 [Marinomonas pontica]|uniref:HipA N-terminal subdomain 1 domain-containing protein n=1 Tax=Marinomonas pontica TaxID=264739 RepID=A0ABM8FH31_9GAMM|nr:hypothetical protein MACH16_31400 [Marinomonas pontica]
MSRRVVDVYAHWMPIDPPLLEGQLTFAESSRGGVFSFAYDKAFLASDYRLQIDPLLTLHDGELHNDSPDKNFRAFLDSSPDRWGRILMQRRAAIEFNKGLRTTSRLTGSTDFLDNNSEFAAPPMASLRELEYVALQIEKDDNIESDEYYRWLKMLISPGSSLGGARPKACVTEV